MELRHLRYFCAVAEELNFTRAAEKLFMAQPPLTRQIKNLEQELGAELINRQPRGLSLTPAGRYFLTQARQILSRAENAVEHTRHLAQHGRGTVNLGFVPSVFYGPLPNMVREVKGQGQVRLNLQELKTQQQVEAIKQGQIDIGFGRLLIDDAEVQQQVLYEEPIWVALPLHHPLANDVPTLEALAACDMVLYPSGSGPNLSDIFKGVFLGRGLKVEVVQHVHDLQTALGLVAADMGFAFVPEMVTQHNRDDICFVPLKDKSIVSPVICSYHKHQAHTEVATLLELISQMVTLHGPVN